MLARLEWKEREKRKKWKHCVCFGANRHDNSVDSREQYPGSALKHRRKRVESGGRTRENCQQLMTTIQSIILGEASRAKLGPLAEHEILTAETMQLDLESSSVPAMAA